MLNGWKANKKKKESVLEGVSIRLLCNMCSKCQDKIYLKETVLNYIVNLPRLRFFTRATQLPQVEQQGLTKRETRQQLLSTKETRKIYLYLFRQLDFSDSVQESIPLWSHKGHWNLTNVNDDVTSQLMAPPIFKFSPIKNMWMAQQSTSFSGKV